MDFKAGDEVDGDGGGASRVATQRVDNHDTRGLTEAGSDVAQDRCIGAEPRAGAWDRVPIGRKQRDVGDGQRDAVRKVGSGKREGEGRR